MTLQLFTVSVKWATGRLRSALETVGTNVQIAMSGVTSRHVVCELVVDERGVVM